MAEVLEFYSEALWIDEVARRLLAAIHGRPTMGSDGRIHVVLSGGKTPAPAYVNLGSLDLRWDEVGFWLADERCVSLGAEDRNERMIREMMGRDNPSVLTNLHSWGALDNPLMGSDLYESEMRAVFGSYPRFALIFLGIGEDGHTASLFPNSPELLETNHWAMPTSMAYGGFQRVTLTRPVLEAAGEIVFLVRGDVKKAMVERVARGDSTIPAGSLLNSNQKILWLRD